MLRGESVSLVSALVEARFAGTVCCSQRLPSTVAWGDRSGRSARRLTGMTLVDREAVKESGAAGSY